MRLFWEGGSSGEQKKFEMDVLLSSGRGNFKSTVQTAVFNGGASLLRPASVRTVRCGEIMSHRSRRQRHEATTARPFHRLIPPPAGRHGEHAPAAAGAGAASASAQHQGFISRPVTGNRRAPVLVYRTDLTGYRSEPVEFKSKFK